MNSRCFSRKHGIAALAVLAILWSPRLCPVALAQANVLTNKVDNSRSGLNPNETLLTTSSVNTNQFGKLYTFNVDGYVSAQPLYMSNVTISGGAHNVVFVATEHNSVYAIDADTGVQLWQTNLGTSVPIATQGCSAVTKLAEIGILGTPVIDPVSGTLYVSAKTQVAGTPTTYAHSLHALDITTGFEKFGGPASISGTVGSDTFVALNQMQRPGLLLSNGSVYIAFGSNGCDMNARGWMFAYNAADLTQPPVVMTTQQDNNFGSSVWQAGVGPAADSAGNIYISTANGLFQYPNSLDLGDSIVKLSPGLTVSDYFTPFDQATLSSSDLDLGSGAPILLPPQTGSTTPNLMVTSGKDADIYLISTDNLGQFNSTNQIVQYIPSALLGQFFGSPLYWNNGTSQLVYFLAHQDYLRSYTFSTDVNGITTLSTSPYKTTVGKLTTFGLPEISANGMSNGIVWLVRNVSGVPLLSAYDAANLFLLYDSGMAANGRDSLGTITHFATPTIANGKVFAGTQTQLVSYGLFPAITLTAGNNQTGNAGSTLPVALVITAINPYTGSPTPGVSVTFSDGGKGGTFGTPSPIITDSNGVASTTYTLPKTPQTLTITATSPGYATATFTETGVVGPCAALSTVSGGKQVGTVGTTLPLPIVVKAKDAVGNVVPGASISFVDNASPNGSFNPNPAITGSNGQASTTYTLPTVAKALTVTATCLSVSLKISEQSVPGPAAALNILQGNNQIAHPNNKLPKTLIVQLVDQYGNGISGQTITFTDNGAGGTLTPSAPVTNSAGKVTVTYTTGPNTGTVTITASYSTFSVNFTETVD